MNQCWPLLAHRLGSEGLCYYDSQSTVHALKHCHIRRENLSVQNRARAREREQRAQWSITDIANIPSHTSREGNLSKECNSMLSILPKRFLLLLLLTIPGCHLRSQARSYLAALLDNFEKALLSWKMLKSLNMWPQAVNNSKKDTTAAWLSMLTNVIKTMATQFFFQALTLTCS